MDEGDADIVEDGPAAPVEDIDEIGATSASTADDARSMLMSLLHPQQGGLTDDSDDDPITIHTAHVNTEDEDQFYDEDEDEFWVDGPDDIEGEPESHSARCLLQFLSPLPTNSSCNCRCGMDRLFTKLRHTLFNVQKCGRNLVWSK